jgi:hypothetical protein
MELSGPSLIRNMHAGAGKGAKVPARNSFPNIKNKLNTTVILSLHNPAVKK